MLRAPRAIAFAEIFRRACGYSHDNPLQSIDDEPRLHFLQHSTKVG